MNDIGMYLYQYGSNWVVKLPNYNCIYFHKEAFHAAKSERDRLCKSLNLDPYRFKLSAKGGRLGRTSALKKHTDLPDGITRSTITKKGIVYFRIVSLLSTPYKKTFNYGKNRTEAKAIEMAIAWRDVHKPLL